MNIIKYIVTRQFFMGVYTKEAPVAHKQPTVTTFDDYEQAYRDATYQSDVENHGSIVKVDVLGDKGPMNVLERLMANGGTFHYPMGYLRVRITDKYTNEYTSFVGISCHNIKIK